MDFRAFCKQLGNDADRRAFSYIIGLSFIGKTEYGDPLSLQVHEFAQAFGNP